MRGNADGVRVETHEELKDRLQAKLLQLRGGRKEESEEVFLCFLLFLSVVCSSAFLHASSSRAWLIRIQYHVLLLRHDAVVSISNMRLPIPSMKGIESLHVQSTCEDSDHKK